MVFPNSQGNSRGGRGGGRGNRLEQNKFTHDVSIATNRTNRITNYLKRGTNMRQESRFQNRNIATQDSNNEGSRFDRLEKLLCDGFTEVKKDMREFNDRLQQLEDTSEFKFNEHQNELIYIRTKMAQKNEVTGLDVTGDEEFYSLRDLFVKQEIIDAYVFDKFVGETTNKALTITFNCEATKIRVMKKKVATDRAAENTPSVYFNHVLPKATRMLFVEAKKLKKEGKIVDVWAKGTKVL